ncbi:MAG: serine kinase [Firmicutes bacterium]|nr:serine kinase [Candidatus Fermentithermobacillaceae bacterium]
MRVDELVSRLGLQVKSMSKAGGAREIGGGFVGDVLSHVLANARPQDVWVTVQTHENVVAVAVLLDVACVVVCQREVPPETCRRAQSEGVALLWTELGAFEVAGKLYGLLSSQAMGSDKL